MTTRSEDLNLLFLFEALMETRSVSRASERLGISQSTTSHTLNRMRLTFDDPLFVRVKNVMVPSPLAERIAPSVKQVMDVVRGEVFRVANFRPQLTERTFTLCMSDIASMAYLPSILRAFRAVASNASIRIVSPIAEKLEEGLENGSVDLAIGYFPDLKSAGVFQQRLVRSSKFVCVASSDNVAIGKGPLSRSIFEAAPHVAVRTEGRSHEIVERYMDSQGITRRVVVALPHFLGLLGLIPRSDLLGIIPFDLSPGFLQMPNVTLHPLPFSSPDVKVTQVWHRRVHKDLANQWLRTLVRRTLQQSICDDARISSDGR